MITLSGLILSFIAGALGAYFGHWGGVAAVVVGEIAMALLLSSSNKTQ